jgi:adenylylsulfate kinase-like enzyme
MTLFEPPSAMLLNGTVGVGKTTTADAAARLLAGAGIPGACTDVDALRQVWPAPHEDLFHHRLTLHNLTSWARTALAAGAHRILVAAVVESQSDREDYAAALGVSLQVVRLVAPAEVVRERLRRRHHDDADGLAWHLRRAHELATVLDRARLEDLEISTSEGEPDSAARQVIA